MLKRVRLSDPTGRLSWEELWPELDSSTAEAFGVFLGKLGKGEHFSLCFLHLGKKGQLTLYVKRASV